MPGRERSKEPAWPIACLLISWGPPVRGREVRSLEVFNEAVGLFGSMQQGGRIESFDITIMRPNGHFNGYMQLHGSAAQLDAVREAEDFRRMILDAQMCVEDLRHLDGMTNDGRRRGDGACTRRRSRRCRSTRERVPMVRRAVRRTMPIATITACSPRSPRAPTPRPSG